MESILVGLVSFIIVFIIVYIIGGVIFGIMSDIFGENKVSGILTAICIIIVGIYTIWKVIPWLCSILILL